MTEKTAVPHCLAHSRSDPTQCAICESGFTAPACTGTPFCYVQNRDINGNILASCSVCVTGYIKTLTGACVLQRVSNCEIAYDSFLCAKCKDGYNNVYNQAHEVSPWFSACDVSETKGCALAGTDGKCARCRFAEYGMINGACVANDGSADYPVYCAEYRYNQTLKKLQCNRCENGYGLS